MIFKEGPNYPLRKGAGPVRVCIENRNFSTLISNECVFFSSILDSHSVISSRAVSDSIVLLFTSFVLIRFELPWLPSWVGGPPAKR